MSRSNNLLGSEKTILVQLGLVGFNVSQESKSQINNSSQIQQNANTKLPNAQVPRERNHRHSMLVTNRSIDKDNELQKQHCPVNKLFTQLYKLDNDIITSLLGGDQPAQINQEVKQEIGTQPQRQEIDASFLGTTFGNPEKQMLQPQLIQFQSQQQLQKVLLSQRQQKNSNSQLEQLPISNLKLPTVNQINSHIKGNKQFSGSQRGKLNSSRGRSPLQDETISSKKGIYSYENLKTTSSVQSSNLKSMSSSTVQGQNNNNRGLNSTPKKRSSLPVIDFATESLIFENIFRKIYGPRKSIQRHNSCLTSPKNKFRVKSQKNQNQLASKFENFHATFTIKEANEDLEQSSKGGSQLFKSKGLIQAKGSIVLSQKDKKTDQEGEGSQSHLGVDQMNSTSLQQSLSFTQGRWQHLKSNGEHEEKMIESVNLDDFSDINQQLQITTINKDKRLSNPDPNDRKIRRMEILLEDQVRINDQTANLLLIKQLTQDIKSPELQLNFQHIDHIPEQFSNPLQSIEKQNKGTEGQILNFPLDLRKNDIEGLISSNNLQLSPSTAICLPLSAQFKTQKFSPRNLNERDYQIAQDGQIEPAFQNVKYRFCHGSQNFQGKNLIRALKQIQKRITFNQGSLNQQFGDLLDLTRKKVLLDFVDGVKEVDPEAVKNLKVANAKRILETVQIAQQNVQTQPPVRNGDSTSSNRENARLSFETNGLNPIIFTEDFIQFQDDFTPSNCLRSEQSSSDINSSAYNQHLSQIEPFNPDLYEMEPVFTSSEISFIQPSLYQLSLNNSRTNNLKDSLPENQFFESGTNQDIQLSNQNKTGAENFTQHLLASNSYLKFQRVTEERINFVDNPTQQVKKLTTTNTETVGSLLEQLSSYQYSPINFKSNNLEPHINNPVIEITLAEKNTVNDDDIYLPQPSRRYTSSNFLSDHQSEDNSLPRDSTEVKAHQQQFSGSDTPRSDLKEENQEDPNTLPNQLNPGLVKFLNQDEINQLSACIPKLQNFNQSLYQKISQSYGQKIEGLQRVLKLDSVQERPIQNYEVQKNENHLITQVTQGVNQRFQRALTQASDARCRDRGHQDKDNGSLNIPFSSRPQKKKPHISITTTSMVSSKKHGMVRINQYQILQKIGEGKFAKVKLCVDVNTNEYFAAKIINKNKIRRKTIIRPQQQQDSIQQEMAIMKKLDHPFILKLYEIIDDPAEKKLYLITDFVKQGNLEKKVKMSPDQLLNPECPSMRNIFRQLIEALDYCHSVVNIIHRDIKPENILIDDQGNVKLADFGVSSMLPLDRTDLTSSNAGSAIFYSPEACNGKQYRGRLNDLWACGVTLYFMCTGAYPFVETNHQKLFELIKFKSPEFPAHLQGTLLKDLICKMLEKNEKDRLTMAEIKVHPWVTNNGQLPPIPNVSDEKFEQPSKQDVLNLTNKVKKNVKYIVTKKSKVGIDSKSAI